MTTATIEITDHETGSPVSISALRYIIEYRVAGTGSFIRYYPDQVTPPLIVEALLDDTLYDIRIARVCTNQAQSPYLEFQIQT